MIVATVPSLVERSTVRPPAGAGVEMLTVAVAPFPPRTLFGSTSRVRTIGRTITLAVAVVKLALETEIATFCTELTMFVLKVKVLET